MNKSEILKAISYPKGQKKRGYPKGKDVFEFMKDKYHVQIKTAEDGLSCSLSRTDMDWDFSEIWSGSKLSYWDISYQLYDFIVEEIIDYKHYDLWPGFKVKRD